MTKYVIEMPNEVNRCFDCPLFFNWCCMVTNTDNYDKADTKPEWCPLSATDDMMELCEKGDQHDS